MRINQLAREHKLSNRDILDYLASIGITDKTHSSSIDDETRERVLIHFGRKDGEVEEEPKSSRFKRLKRPRGWKPKPPAEKEPKPAVEEIPQTPVSVVEETPPQEIELPRGPAVETEEAVAAAETVSETPPEFAEPAATIEERPIEVSEGAVQEEVVPPVVSTRVAEVSDEAPPRVPRDKERRRRDTDEAIRKEIQKLKQRRKRPAEVEKVIEEEERPRGRISPKGKTKKAWKRSKRERQEAQLAEEIQREKRERTTLKVHEATTVADVASGLGITPGELISRLLKMGVMATVNQRLDMDTIHILADEYGFDVEEVDLFDSDLLAQLQEEEAIPESDLEPRPPVVTVMGHVDHGKTKLLDAIRRSDVVSQEAGGITQHIGAYRVTTPGGTIVFLDTPGHEAFTAMRARGAMVTDIVVLVVAADDGVMPQTIEAIHHAKAAEVPIIVAINKIDLPGANPDRVQHQLAEHGLVPEEWGGQTMCVLCSALKREGIDDLLEHILLQAEVLELKASRRSRVRGAILEAKRDPGRGVVATVLVQHGTLHIGDPCVCGVYGGRVRAMYDDQGKPIGDAGPSMPVEILGLEDVPVSGDPFVVVPSDSYAKQISARLQQIQRARELRRTHRVTLEDLHAQVKEGQIKELNLIVKADVQGSVEALCSSLDSIESQKVKVNILHNGVGAISESDVMLASASNALVIGFNIRPTPGADDLARQEGVQIRTYRVIYEAISAIRDAMTGLLEKTYEETILGRGEIREIFRIDKGLSIAGSYVRSGRLARNANVRVLRDSVVVHEGKLVSLRRFKEDVKEVPQGMECGIGLERFSDLRVGDIVECYELREVAATLD